MTADAGRRPKFARFGHNPFPWEEPNPVWEALQAAKRLVTRPRVKGKTNAHNALRGAAKFLAETSAGRRNTVLNWAAHAMRKHVAARSLTIYEVRDALRDACITNGHLQDDGEDMVLGSIASGLGISKADLR
jgi:hypothetical protein